MKLAAHLYAVEPREGTWAVIATGSGWQRVELRAGPELLAALDGDTAAEAALVARWRAHPSGRLRLRLTRAVVLAGSGAYAGSGMKRSATPLLQ